MIKIGLTDFTPENKIINIRDKNQVIKAKYAIGKDDVLKYSLMNEHYIEISFEYNRSIAFKRSDYIEWEGEKYTLRSVSTAKQINKRKYQYTLKFEAVEMFFQDIQYYYLNQSLKESEWRLTGNPQYFIKIAIDNINRYFGTTAFNMGTIEPTEIKDILFDVNTDTFDALTQIADEYNAEWYITGKTIHFVNKVSFGSEVDFETEVSVLSMEREDGDTNTRYTRIVALGSTRNIPYNYRETTPGESVDAIYQKRLRIPASKGDVVDAYSNMTPDEVVEGTVVFDEVYPKRIGTIEAVGTIEYNETNEETGEVTKWNAYKIKDSGIKFKKEYLLPGQELKLSMQSSDLNGRDFALIFHEKGFSKTDDSQYFEIVRTDEYGKPLPNDIMKPKVGDKYVLYGFNIALVSDQYVPAGEQELYDVAVEWQKKQLRDTSVYECPTVIQHFMDRQMDLAIGQKVRLVHEQFENRGRSSRIMGFEKQLNNKYNAKYTVGDNSTYSRFNKIEKEIKELQHAGVVYENTGGGSGVYVIKQFDSTRPTDFNVYSAAASQAKYLNKQTGGTVMGDTIFQKNTQVMGTAVSDVFQNSTFTAGQLGSGFQIKRDANGQSYMEIDNLLVRREAVFNRLTIAEIKSVGGTILLSLANMKISKVEVKTSSWKCFFDNEEGTIPNDFAIGDQAICRKFTGKNIKYYWALVTAVGNDFIELSKTDKDGSGVPDIDDEVVQLGNRTDVNRQYAIMLSAYGSDAPSIKQYAGINSYDMTGKEVTAISPKGNKFTGSFSISTNGTTAPIYKDSGIFENGRTYYLNDRVSHLGSYWVCIVNSTIQTPSETSSVWRKDTTGTTDINNAVNKIQIGGVNLLSNYEHIKSQAAQGQIIEYVDDAGYLDIMKITNPSLAANIALKNIIYPHTSTGQYVVSILAKGSGNLDLYTNGGYFNSTESLSPSEYKRIEIKTTTVAALHLNTRRCTLAYVAKMQVETGNKGTTLSAAQGDLEQAANKASVAASVAQTDANTANLLLADIANDNKFMPSEKQELKREWDTIVSEYSKNITQASIFGISSTAYTTAYNSLSSYITPLLSNLNVTSDVVGATLRNTFKTYYDARLDLLNAIAKKTKDLADAAQIAANNAIQRVSVAESSITVLQNEIKQTVKQSDFNSLQGRV